MRLFKQDDLVVLCGNPVHLGIIRANQLASNDDVLVEWCNTPPVWMLPGEIILEVGYHSWMLTTGREPARYDVWQPTSEEKEAVMPKQQNLWNAFVKNEGRYYQIDKIG